jgi:hypothetical protein
VIANATYAMTTFPPQTQRISELSSMVCHRTAT